MLLIVLGFQCKCFRFLVECTTNTNLSLIHILHKCRFRQALGSSFGFEHRPETVQHILDTPQKPLVSTWVETFTGGNEVAAGQNVVIMIAPYLGFTQEVRACSHATRLPVQPRH